MSTFYVLPPRPIVGGQLAGLLHTLFPELPWAPAAGNDLAEALVGLLASHDDVFVVHREDLPLGEDAARALADGFGAEAGDEVVEVRRGAKVEEQITRRWRL